MIKLRHACAASALLLTSGAALAETSANIGVTNNYIWRGLTQSNNEAAVSGGLDFAAENGFYIGTWASNVEYASDDTYSYEHDVYFGFAGGSGDFSYDVGWLYYNYDSINDFDFHEIYGSVGWKELSLSLNVLSGTEADEGPGQDFGFGQTYYVAAEYGTELPNGMGVTAHIGYHDGDFSEAFNGVPRAYVDYSVSFAVQDFTFTITDTDLSNGDPSDFLDNGSVKFVVSYSMSFEL